VSGILKGFPSCFSVGGWHSAQVLSITSAFKEKTSAKKNPQSCVLSSINIKECHRHGFVHPVSMQNYFAL
jgi:hypothetical protein